MVNLFEDWKDMDFASTYEPVDWSALQNFAKNAREDRKDNIDALNDMYKDLGAGVVDQKTGELSTDQNIIDNARNEITNIYINNPNDISAVNRARTLAGRIASQIKTDSGITNKSNETASDFNELTTNNVNKRNVALYRKYKLGVDGTGDTAITSDNLTKGLNAAISALQSDTESYNGNSTEALSRDKVLSYATNGTNKYLTSYGYNLATIIASDLAVNGKDSKYYERYGDAFSRDNNGDFILDNDGQLVDNSEWYDKSMYDGNYKTNLTSSGVFPARDKKGNVLYNKPNLGLSSIEKMSQSIAYNAILPRVYHKEETHAPSSSRSGKDDEVENRNTFLSNLVTRSVAATNGGDANPTGGIGEEASYKIFHDENVDLMNPPTENITDNRIGAAYYSNSGNLVNKATTIGEQIKLIQEVTSKTTKEEILPADVSEEVAKAIGGIKFSASQGENDKKDKKNSKDKSVDVDSYVLSKGDQIRLKLTSGSVPYYGEQTTAGNGVYIVTENNKRYQVYTSGDKNNIDKTASRTYDLFNTITGLTDMNIGYSNIKVVTAMGVDESEVSYKVGFTIDSKSINNILTMNKALDHTTVSSLKSAPKNTRDGIVYEYIKRLPKITVNGKSVYNTSNLSQLQINGIMKFRVGDIGESALSELLQGNRCYDGSYHFNFENMGLHRDMTTGIVTGDAIIPDDNRSLSNAVNNAASKNMSQRKDTPGTTSTFSNE